MSNAIDDIKRYNLDEEDFWEIKFGNARGQKIIKFDGVAKIIDIENIKFEISDNLDVSPAVALKVRGYIEPSDQNGYSETIEETTFGEANDNNCTNQYFWAMAEKRGKARACLKILNLYGRNSFYSDVEADDFQRVNPTTTKIKAFNKLRGELLKKQHLLTDADNEMVSWLKKNRNGILKNIDMMDKATDWLEVKLKEDKDK